MTATAIATAKPPARPRRQRRVARQLLLTAHVLVSVGWNGVALGQLALAITASVDDGIRHPAYELMHVFDRALNIPLALLTLATGILISLRTRWGLLHHWWVVTKLAITVVAVLFAAAFMRTMIVRAGHATADGNVHYSAPTAAIITGACLMNAMFITATFLSTLKPWGRTSRGLRASRSAGAHTPASAANGTSAPPTTRSFISTAPAGATTAGTSPPAVSTSPPENAGPAETATPDHAGDDGGAVITGKRPGPVSG
ncbi:RAD23 family protein [Parafrankia discariae]|uniref:hypothetical protein n=1 Tax=Parafrankia discariae TaxID=365528 RepID=UPI00039995F9|nr:hypothetical protein [Parafrankia discariae]